MAMEWKVFSRVLRRCIHQTPWKSEVKGSWDVQRELKVAKDFQRMRDFTQEGIQALTALKLIKSDSDKVDAFLKKNTPRMLKKDMICIFYLLRRHREPDLAAKVFEVIKKESWFEPNLLMYWEMSVVYVEAKRLDELWILMDEMESQGVPPSAKMFTSAITCCLESTEFGWLEKLYRRMLNTPSMQLSDCFLVGLRNKLRGASKLELAGQVAKDLRELRKNRRATPNEPEQ